MRDYLTPIDVITIHDDQLTRYGGARGIRDMGLLQAALFRPQTGYYPDLISEASALWESLAQNHPFIDGNKRTAFACCYTFLVINGKLINAGAEETYEFIMGLYESQTFSLDRLDEWLRENTVEMR